MTPAVRLPAVDVVPLHPDGTECDHRISPSGKPRDPDSGCTGRARYLVECRGQGCGWKSESNLRAVADEARKTHRAKHVPE